MAKRKNPSAVELAEAVAATQAQAMQYRRALADLVGACGHVNLGALKGTTVKDFRKVLKFMNARDAAKELLGDNA